MTRFEIFQKRASFTSRAYTNFASFFAEAAFTMGIANHAFAQSGHKIDRIVLTYNDEFIAEDIDWPIEEALNPNTDFVAKACLQRGEFWHSSIGFFDKRQSEDEHLLHNVKISHALIMPDDATTGDDTELKYILSLELFHVLKISDSQTDETFLPLLESCTMFLRTEHKIILANLLSEKLRKRIGLSKDDGEIK